MFRFVWQRFKNTTFFEKMLLIVGIAISIAGFYMINNMYIMDSKVSWALIQAAFLYLLLIFTVILTDSSESVKEELKVVIKEQAQEIRLLRKITEEQLEEIRLLRRDINKKM